MNDKLLWQLIQKDDHLALKKVFELYYKIMCSYILQFTNDVNDTEDIVQTAFIKLWEKRHKIHITTSLKSYLFQTAYHLFIDETKKQNRKVSMLEKMKYEIITSYIEEDKEVSIERSKKIRKLINDLPDKCKEILLLSKEKGLKNKEIAVELNISIKTVESQIRIAFQKIRNNF
ncbi:sigma-70 family RNA polymerase sigma factor [uncultured Dokdonia sp.]|uniref:RNA polymerase sigma factor n=1 Tax=uncultured Dokdonia sp. TaxID=575653 RepID=UPI002603BA32|nr:sigma-70 family RNA polymerase sigma factor [uncultured Dokdonia sp.]